MARTGSVASVAIALSMSLSCSSTSGQQAVAQVNGEATLKYSYEANRLATIYGYDYKLDVSAWSTGGAVNFPIWRYVGASVFALTGRQQLTFEDPGTPYYWPQTFSCRDSQWLAGASTFVRDPELGRVRANYQTGRQEPTCVFPNTYGSYGADAEYYFTRWTVGAAFGREWRGDEGWRYGGVRYGVSALYYPIDELRIGGTYAHSAHPADTNRYGVSIEYQPTSLGNQVSVGFGYERRIAGYSEANVFLVTISYLFGAQTDLRTRDRYYR